ncbi:hypothetical protein HYU14_00935 [Candidatus Woesearchaeota archaeon]|nr:hypothetical protein [Candidatus Woesearchaeota archaeon]
MINNQKNNYPNIIVFTSLLLLTYFIPSVYSLSLPDLLSSYDFSYTGPEMNITNFTVGANDTEGNASYEQLLIHILTNNQAGNYSFTGDLYKDGRWITTVTEFYSIQSGSNNVTLAYEATLLTDGAYNLSLTVQKDFLTVYQRQNAHSFDYDSADFVQPAFSASADSFGLLDTNANGRAEFLQVNGTINTTLTGDFNLSMQIKGGNSSLGTKKLVSLAAGQNSFSVSINGSQLKKLRLENGTVYQLIIRDGVNYLFELGLNTSYGLDELEAGQTLFADSFEEGTADLNGNNQTDLLEFNISLLVEGAGNYNISFDLVDPFNGFVLSEKKSFSLASGLQKAAFPVNGTMVFLSKLNGPYKIKSLLLEQGNITLDAAGEAYTTKPYTFADFEQPPFADIAVNNPRTNATHITFEASNGGDANAFSFSVAAFSSNLTQLDEHIIDILAPGESKSISLKANSSQDSSFFIIADFDNLVDEANETNNIFLLNVTNGSITFAAVLPSAWSLISLPVNLTNYSFAAITSGLNVSSVFSYNSSDKRYLFFKNRTNFTFSTLDPLQGFWIKLNTPGNLSLDGLSFTYPIGFSLLKGWNLISYPSALRANASHALQGVNSSFDSAASYQNGAWISFDKRRNETANSLKFFEPGIGYWMHVNQDVNWKFDGSEFSLP